MAIWRDKERTKKVLAFDSTGILIDLVDINRLICDIFHMKCKPIATLLFVPQNFKQFEMKRIEMQEASNNKYSNTNSIWHSINADLFLSENELKPPTISMTITAVVSLYFHISNSVGLLLHPYTHFANKYKWFLLKRPREWSPANDRKIKWFICNLWLSHNHICGHLFGTHVNIL